MADLEELRKQYENWLNFREKYDVVNKTVTVRNRVSDTLC